MGKHELCLQCIFTHNFKNQKLLAVIYFHDFASWIVLRVVFHHICTVLHLRGCTEEMKTQGLILHQVKVSNWCSLYWECIHLPKSSGDHRQPKNSVNAVIPQKLSTSSVVIIWVSCHLKKTNFNFVKMYILQGSLYVVEWVPCPQAGPMKYTQTRWII